MERLSALDNSFLQVETPTAHMHVGWLSMLELPAGARELSVAALSRRIAARLNLAPRFRQVVTPVPVGRPVWVDEPCFRLSDHVRVLRESVAEEEEVGELCGEFLSAPLDRARPLWEIAVVPRVGDGRAAVLGKVHHAMVDGLAAVELGMLLFDLEPDAPVAQPEEWEPEPAGAPLRLAADAITDTAIEQFRTARRLARLGLEPRRATRVADSMRRAALSIAEDVINPAPPSLLNVGITPTRALITERVSLARLARIKEARGVKLNDLVLGLVAGTLRGYAAICGAEAQPVRAMVPVSVRSSGDSAGQGNRITFAFVELPVDEPTASRRLAILHERTSELKASGRIAGSEAILRAMDPLPGLLQERAARIAASPRMYNLVVSNVPGPRTPLYAAGARVSEIYPVIPISDGHGLAIGVLTYGGALHFAAYVDPTVLSDAAELGRLLRAQVRELEGSGRRRRAREPHPSQAGSSKPAYS